MNKVRIILYDIPCVHETKIWSPNSSKSRFLMNYLGIPYDVEWVNFDTMPSKFEALGVPKNSFKPEYWVPTIQLANGEFVTSSTNIALYFEKNYKQQMYPDESYYEFSKNFVDWFGFSKQNKLMPFYINVVTPHEELILTTESSREYFHNKFGSILRKDLAELRSNKKLASQVIQEAYEFLRTMQNEFSGYDGFDRTRFMSGNYLYGDKISYADIFALSMLMWPIHVSEAQFNHFFEWPSGTEWLHEWYNLMMDKVLYPKPAVEF